MDFSEAYNHNKKLARREKPSVVFRTLWIVQTVFFVDPKEAKGSSINHVDNFLDIIDPHSPSLWAILQNKGLCINMDIW